MRRASAQQGTAAVRESCEGSGVLGLHLAFGSGMLLRQQKSIPLAGGMCLQYIHAWIAGVISG